MIPSVVALAARAALAQGTEPKDVALEMISDVSLRQEIALLGSYLEIQGVRFREQRNVQVDVSPNAMEARVPTLLLQLLVENAMWQMERTSRTGTVRVSADREGDELHLGVRIVIPFRTATA
jgi:LytS/YehU family sensor histidine kinase